MFRLQNHTGCDGPKGSGTGGQPRSHGTQMMQSKDETATPVPDATVPFTERPGARKGISALRFPPLRPPESSNTLVLQISHLRADPASLEFFKGLSLSFQDPVYDR
jgi:hypothetical protein